MVCSNCKQSGHNVRKCKMKRVAEVESVDVQVESVAESVESVEALDAADEGAPRPAFSLARK